MTIKMIGKKSENLKVLFFGLGSIGQKHATIIKNNFEYKVYAFRTEKGQEKNRLKIKEFYNLDEAFSIKPNRTNILQGSYVVIIDDVVTTGATVNSLCQLLLQAGVKRIDVWCVCRTALATQKHK